MVLGWGAPARADFSAFGGRPDNNWIVPPGTIDERLFSLLVCRKTAYSVPPSNVVYAEGGTFLDGETVTATISDPKVSRQPVGTADLVGETTVTGTVFEGWEVWLEGDGTSGCFEFSPEVRVRFTAASAADLGCDDRPGAEVWGYIEAHVDFVGDAGTLAQTTATLPDGSEYEAILPAGVICPGSAPTSTPTDPPPVAVGATPPATDAAPTEVELATTNGPWLGVALIAALGFLLLGLLGRSDRTDHRPRRWR